MQVPCWIGASGVDGLVNVLNLHQGNVMRQSTETSQTDHRVIHCICRLTLASLYLSELHTSSFIYKEISMGSKCMFLDWTRLFLFCSLTKNAQG